MGKEVGMGHNNGPTLESLSDDQRKALHFKHVAEYAKALEAKKACDASFKNVCKLIKSEGDSVDAVKLTIQLETPDGEAKFKERVAKEVEVARWNGLQIGDQTDLFADRAPAVDKAREEGRVAGLAAKDCSPPYDGDMAQAWIEGWHEGQAVVAGGFIEELRKNNELAAKGEKPKKRGRPKKGAAEQAADEFDDAMEDAGSDSDGAPGDAGSDPDLAPDDDGDRDLRPPFLQAKDDDLELPEHLRRSKEPEPTEAE